MIRRRGDFEAIGPGKIAAVSDSTAQVSGEPVVIVPGYTPPGAAVPVKLHPTCLRRVEQAWTQMQDLGIGWVILTGGAVYPPGTPYIEAEEMAKALRGLGCDGDRILVEPHARHTTTNLRNAGRLMLDRGWRRARVITTLFQAVYLAWPNASGFHRRCERELGYRVGVLSRVGWTGVVYEPSGRVRLPGTDELDP
jgi:hypothetical protein